MARSSASGTSLPITAAIWSSRFSSGGSRSMRAARTAWTVAGTRMLAERSGQPVGTPLAHQRAGLDQAPDALLQEERVALGPLDQERRFSGSSDGIVAEQARSSASAPSSASGVDPKLGVVASCCPRCGCTPAGS